MLDPWALGNSSWKKRLVGAIYERDCLEHAGCLHVLTTSERNAVRRFGLRNPVCVIPNGVDLPPLAFDGDSVALAASPERRTLLYVGRFHPKKGLANLLHAWSVLQQRGFAPLKQWSLALIGWDQDGHEDELRRLAVELKIAADVQFRGPAFGPAKAAAYREASAAVLPSFSEGLPMSVLEAWSYGKPVLMTPECNLPEGATANAAITVAPTIVELASGLAMLLEATDQERLKMGRRGRDLVEQQFTWDRAADEMVAVYRWLVGGGTAPACVEM